MGKKILITNLSLPQYVGICENLNLDSHGFKRKEFRIDYSGACDIGTQRVEMFPLLSDFKNRPKEIMVSRIDTGKHKNQYSAFALDHYINDINEKTMRPVVTIYPLITRVNDFNGQIHNVLNSKSKKVPAVDLNDHTHILLSQIEMFFYLLNSALDLYAKLSQVFNQRAPGKFGKQLYNSVEKKIIWDKGYQAFLRQQKEFKSWLNKYRNELAHEFSLKVRFKKINKNWRTIISSDYYSPDGLVIPDALEILWEKYLNFTKFFDQYYFKKLPKLSILVTDNLIT